MSFIQRLLIGWAIAFAILAAVIVTRPADYDIERTRLIAAPVDVVFDQVHDLRKSEAWLPWKTVDPSYVFAYSDQHKGVGANYTWTCDTRSTGSLATIEVIPNELVKNRIQSADMGETIETFRFEPSDGGVRVHWRFAGEVPGIFGGFISRLMRPTLEGMFDDGLAELERSAHSAVEANAGQVAPPAVAEP